MYLKYSKASYFPSSSVRIFIFTTTKKKLKETSFAFTLLFAEQEVHNCQERLKRSTRTIES